MSGGTTYPTHCSKRDTPSSRVCNRLLRKTVVVKGVRRSMPSRQFLHNDTKQWLARLYSRPGIEAHLDRDVLTDTGQETGIHRDIWDAPALRSFLGPDGRSPFMKRPGNEGRLIFSLCMDGFNPYQRKEAGKKVSAGAIYMVCLNLPPEIRYDMENMFLVGIIPGPNEPSLHQINHILSIIVDDLLELWHNGVFLHRTSLHPHGRCVRCALGPLICDLPAARQMAGMASYSSRHFCSRCLLKRDDIEDFNPQHWSSRTWQQHVDIATKWRDAQSEEERDDIFEEHGLRWTELLRLPYWDPTRFVLIDSMHGLLLGALKRHVREIWGMDIKFEDGDGRSFDKSKHQPSEEQMQEAHQILRAGSCAALGKLKAPVLRQLCRDTQSMRFAYKKKRLLQSLIEYVSVFNVISVTVLMLHVRGLSEDGLLVRDRLSFHQVMVTINRHSLSRLRSPPVHNRQQRQIMWTLTKPWPFSRLEVAKRPSSRSERLHLLPFALSNCDMPTIMITTRIQWLPFSRNLLRGQVVHRSMFWQIDVYNMSTANGRWNH
jgi:hypothetical protein